MDKKFMKLAFGLARRGVGFTSPNPCVGAVIVNGGRIIARGWHRRAGADHAEIDAMKKVIDKNELVGAEMYVTLEPCCHHGKTPPCCEAIVAAGIVKVYAGMKDPSVKVNGKGMQYLRSHGVEVVCLDDDDGLNRDFVKFSRVGLPYVVLKVAMSLNGKITRHKGVRTLITGESAREDAYVERSKCDAVIVGAETVVVDDPVLAAYGEWEDKRLLRVVLDGRLRAPIRSRVFRDNDVLVASTDRLLKSREKVFASKGVEVIRFGKEKVSVPRLLRYLAARGVMSVFVEGGSVTHDSFFRYADEIIVYMSPRKIHSVDAVPVFSGLQFDKENLPSGFGLVESKRVGKDLKIVIRKK